MRKRCFGLLVALLLSSAPIPLLSYGYAYYFQNPTSSDSSSEQPLVSPAATTPSNTSYYKRNRGKTRWALQARGGAFFPLTKELSETYGIAWPAAELEISCCLSNIRHRRNRWLLWGNAGWITKLGTEHHKSRISHLNLYPFSLGLEYQTRFFGCVDFYLGAAPAYSLLRVKNYDCSTMSHLDHNAWGFMTKTGFRINFSRHFFFDLYGDYYYTRFSKLHNSIQSIDSHFKGFIAGGGIGGKF